MAHALVERKRFIPIFRKLRSEEKRKITLFYRDFLQRYRNLMLPTSGAEGAASSNSLKAFLGRESNENEVAVFDFEGVPEDRLELRVTLFMALICHCLPLVTTVRPQTLPYHLARNSAHSSRNRLETRVILLQ